MAVLVLQHDDAMLNSHRVQLELRESMFCLKLVYCT